MRITFYSLSLGNFTLSLSLSVFLLSCFSKFNKIRSSDSAPGFTLQFKTKPKMKTTSCPNLNRETTSFPNFFTLVEQPDDDDDTTLEKRQKVDHGDDTSSVGSNQFSGDSGARSEGHAWRNIARDAIKEDSWREFLTELEPFLRSVVREELERALCARARLYHSSSGTSLNQSESSQARVWQLHFVDKLPPTLITGSRIESEDCNYVTIVILDSVSKQVVSSGPFSSLEIQIVVLDADFGADDKEDWTEEEFNANLVREREGKRPLVTGDLVVTLRNGVGSVGDVSFTDNSSWIRSGKFRLGARPVQSTSTEVRIREARSEAFVVKDQGGELYKKHHPPKWNEKYGG